MNKGFKAANIFILSMLKILSDILVSIFSFPNLMSFYSPSFIYTFPLKFIYLLIISYKYEEDILVSGSVPTYKTEWIPEILS